jgi:hypothetical protein
VIECLGDPDETIQRMTLELLYTMTNPANVTVVAEKLLENLCTQADKFLREVSWFLFVSLRRLRSCADCAVGSFLFLIRR